VLDFVQQGSKKLATFLQLCSNFSRTFPLGFWLIWVKLNFRNRPSLPELEQIACYLRSPMKARFAAVIAATPDAARAPRYWFILWGADSECHPAAK
jgi:hypothetical protein